MCDAVVGIVAGLRREEYVSTLFQRKQRIRPQLVSGEH